jgi:hypothetical protein
MITQKISTALRYAALVDGGSDNNIVNFSTKSIQMLLLIPAGQSAYSFQWTIDNTFDYYLINSIKSNLNSHIVISFDSFVPCTTPGQSGIVEDNQIFFNPNGIVVKDIAEKLGITQIYITLLGVANDSAQLIFNGYTYNGNIEAAPQSLLLATDSGEEIVTNLEENITVEV